jgi:serine/threonine-protein phosphatase 2B catalytic subunit
MLLAVLSVCSPEELEDEPSSDDGAADRAIIDQATTADMRASRRQQIKNKILAVGKMQLMFQNLRYATVNHRWTYTHVGYIQ